MKFLPTYENTRSSEELAAAFGWNQPDLRSVNVRHGANVVDAQRGTISGEPAAVFGTVVSRNGRDPLNDIALYAYHASAPWGVLADEAGLTIYNSQWLIDTAWFRLPQISWDRIEENVPLLDAFTPGGFLEQLPTRMATKVREPSDFLKPIDDSLVERLDQWRDQALRYARHTDRVDELLQTFYAQLFVMRTVEDRALDNRVEPVSTAASGSDRFDRSRWVTLLDQARSFIGSDLFDNDVTLAIPDHVLTGVIHELYRPHRVPGENARYNFSWIDADVLGYAYEKYLASVLQPTTAPSQVDLFLPAERGVERYSIRKTAGAYYTPRYITEFLSKTTVDDFYVDRDPQSLPSIIDFACGSGSFLVAAIDKVLRHLKQVNEFEPWAKLLIAGGHVAGVDVDEKAVTAARLHLWQRLIEEPGALPLPSLSEVIVVGDGLNIDTWGALNKKYDIVLGNPPFLATSLVGSRSEIETRFETARGRYDYSSLFIEQSLNVLEEGGRLGLVVPNRLFRNKSGGPVRKLLTEKAQLESVVDFGSTKPFDADAYVGCITARRSDQPLPGSLKVRVVEVRSLEPDFIAALLLAAHEGTTLSNSETVRTFTARHPRGEAPWLLLSDEEQISRLLIEEVSTRLDTIAAIPQGIRTGANDFFFVTLTSDDGSSLAKVQNGFGDTFVIETEILELSVYGSQVRRYENITTDSRLIYPYRNNVAISEGELEHRFPHAWAYFQLNREILGARSSLKKSNRRYYELVWPRDESWLRKPKLMIRDLAPTTAFAADQGGRIFLVGGTAVVPEDPELLLPLMAYLNSSFVDALVRQTTPQFRGSFQKFEPQHIQGIPVLDRVLQDEQLLAQLTLYASAITGMAETEPARKELERQVDQLLFSAAEERGIELGST